ncbi:MAG TPA: PRC-barrel domain-containing protein [Candidatus Limnocylindria bacterium]|nr:PRC-barrel domain-containing protein [Candidatus Limnocylindria bacterium]
MKFIPHRLSFGIAMSVIAASAFGQTPAAERPHRTGEPYPAENQWNRKLVNAGDRASKLIGTDIKDASDAKVGKIHDLAVDLSSGKVVEVIVSVGGVLGVGDRLVAAPPSLFTVDVDQHVHTGSDKAAFKDAPEFDATKWNDSLQPSNLAVANRYFQKGYEATDRSDHYPATSTDGPRLASASKLIGMTVKNNQDETVGKVDDLVIHWGSRRMPEVVVAAGGFLGVGEELNAVPPSSFLLDADNKNLTLNVSKEELTKAPRFKRVDWAQAGSTSNIVEVYTYYHAKPYYNSGSSGSSTVVDADNSGRNVRDRNKAFPTPFEQGTGQADIDVTRNIRKDLQSRTDLSVNAQNVKVITRNGEVVLRGPVESEAEKMTIQQVASKYVPATSIDNRLEVKTDTNR